MLLADRTLSMFDFQEERLRTNIRLPRKVIDQTAETLDRIATEAGTLANKFSGGSKMHETI